MYPRGRIFFSCGTCLFVLYVNLALWTPVFQCQLPALLFVCVIIVLFSVFVVVLSSEPKQNQGRGLVDHKLVQAPSNFIAGRPKAALLFWSLLSLDVACCYLWLFSLYINIKIGKK